jgi:hypothetical protein
MGGIANTPQFQNVADPARPQVQQPVFAGATGSAGPGAPPPQGGFPQQPGQTQQPGLVQAGKGGFGQGTPFQMPLPEGYQSPYSNYGFDSGLQSYLDNQNLRSMTDAGTSFQYDPTNQTFTGGTMSGRYNPIPLNVMQEASGGNYGSLSPYFQSRYPQPTSPVPTVKPGMDINQLKEMLAGLPQTQPQGPQQPQIPKPQPFLPRPPGMPQFPQGPQRPMPGIPMPGIPMPGRPMPQFDPRRSGLGALQQMLAGQQVTPGRPALPPGLNGVPGNQNPLYFGPGYK